MKLSPDEIEQRLDQWPVARLSTVDASGAPQVVPIVFARQGDSLWSPIDGKPKSGRELSRVRNVRERPRVGVLLDEYDADWSRLWWIQIDAVARIDQPADPSGDPRFQSAIEALQAKYPQYRDVPVTLDPPTLLELRIERVRSWRFAPHANVD